MTIFGIVLYEIALACTAFRNVETGNVEYRLLNDPDARNVVYCLWTAFDDEDEDDDACWRAACMP
jgi:hypothetical protein